MNIPKEFDDIRPYTPEELPQVYDELETEPKFQGIMSTFMPELSFDTVMERLRNCKSLLDVQKAFSYHLIKRNMERHTDGTDMKADGLDKAGQYTFISNHRDIVLDSAYLSKFLIDAEFSTTVEIAIGDNLLIYPWIKRLVRLNKSFIVKRSLTVRQQLAASKQLSKYLHFAVTQKKENLWIAQREGRAKDSDDRTQTSILKMMALAGDGSICDRLKELNLVPLSISYEYDPCDFLKAKEFQQKRDDPNFHKSTEDDVRSMNTGIFGYKGYVHYQTAASINPWLDTLPDNMTKNELFASVASHIDHEIHSNYRLYANNYIAYDYLTKAYRFTQLYTPEEKKRFMDYIAGQISKIDLPNADHDYLQHKLFEMYANPLVNYLKAAETCER